MPKAWRKRPGAADEPRGPEVVEHGDGHGLGHGAEGALAIPRGCALVHNARADRRTGPALVRQRGSMLENSHRAWTWDTGVCNN